MGRFIEHTSIYGTEISDDENAEAMKLFVNLQAEVITQGISRIHGEFAKFFTLIISRNHLKRRKLVHWPSYMVFRDVIS